MSSSHQQSTSSTNTTTFGGPDADLATRLLQTPSSPTNNNNKNNNAAAEARRRTSEWKPSLPGRTLSFDHEEHKHAMMAVSGALPSSSASSAGPGAGTEGFTERGA